MPSMVQRTSRPIAPLLNAAALVIIVAGLKAAAPIVTQVLLIAFIAIIVTPAYFQLVRWRMPDWLALTIIIAALTVGVLYGITVLTQALTQFARDLPEYHRQLGNQVMRFRTWVSEYDVVLPETLFGDIVSVRNVGVWTRELVTFAGGMLGRGFVVLLIVSFLLCEVATLPRKLQGYRWMTPGLWARMLHVVTDVRHYMGIKTVISMATGFTIYVGLVLLKVDSPLLLGLGVFLLNYIPTVGSIMAGIPAVFLAFIRLGPGRALSVAVLFLVVNQLYGSILEPRLMGRGFGVSPVVILLSLVFWGWVLGPVGMLLSVPLTLGVRVMVESLRDTTPPAVNSPYVPDGSVDLGRPSADADA